jgi:hypothetical protein
VFDSCVQIQPVSNNILHAPVPDGLLASNPTQPPYVPTELLPLQHAIGGIAPASVLVSGHDVNKPSIMSTAGAGLSISSSDTTPIIGANRTCEPSAAATLAASTSDPTPTRSSMLPPAAAPDIAPPKTCLQDGIRKPKKYIDGTVRYAFISSSGGSSNL